MINDIQQPDTIIGYTPRFEQLVQMMGLVQSDCEEGEKARNSQVLAHAMSLIEINIYDRAAKYSETYKNSYGGFWEIKNGIYQLQENGLFCVEVKQNQVVCQLDALSFSLMVNLILYRDLTNELFYQRGNTELSRFFCYLFYRAQKLLMVNQAVLYNDELLLALEKALEYEHL